MSKGRLLFRSGAVRRVAPLWTAFLLATMFAHAASRSTTIQITVLDSQTRSVDLNNNNGVPLNCDQLTFDAYCRSSRAAQMTSTLLVQEGNNPPFRITCTIESRFSKCTPLPKGASFEARREKRGITIFYDNDKGKPRKQFYTLVDTGGKAAPPATVAAIATPQNSPVPAPVAPAAAPRQTSPPPAPVQRTAAPASEPPAGWVRVVPQKVSCNFSSQPAGADITVDGKYVGNTPSAISLGTGTHVVVLSMAGFAEWKRELTVGADSVVNVTANLQKAQP
jgi:hypothetical protein